MITSSLNIKISQQTVNTRTISPLNILLKKFFKGNYRKNLTGSKNGVYIKKRGNTIYGSSFINTNKNTLLPKVNKKIKVTFLYGGKEPVTEDWFPGISHNCSVQTNQPKLRRNILCTTIHSKEFINFKSFDKGKDCNLLPCALNKTFGITSYNRKPFRTRSITRKSQNGNINIFLRKLHKSMKLNNLKIEKHRMNLRRNNRPLNTLKKTSNCSSLLKINSAFQHKQTIYYNKSKRRIDIKIPSNMIY